MRAVAPGYCIVEQPGTLEFQSRMLFRDTLSPAASLFLKLNADTRWLKPGQMLIVADPNTAITTQILHNLRQAKLKTNAALDYMNAEEAGFLHQHYGMIAGLTRAGDQIFGTAGDVGEKYFQAIENTLRKIEQTYQNQYRAQGSLISEQFFAERNQLLNQLKTLVNQPLVKSLAHHTVKLRPYDDMRRALNLSSRSIVHEWSTAGIVGIPGYSTYIGNAAKAAQFLRYGGYIGIGFSFAGTTNDIVKACSAGRENECGKIAFKEYTKFAATTLLGVSGGALGASAGGAICIGLGIISAPAGGAGGLICAAVGSIASGYTASAGGEAIVEYLFRD